MKKIVKLLLFWGCLLSPLSSKSQEFIGLKGINTTGSDPSYQIYGVTSSGDSTLLNSWNATQSITTQIHGKIGTGIINEYEGKIYFQITENPSQISQITYNVEYDISTNNLTKITNKEWELLYPKGIKKIINKKSDGSIHIGENSAVFKEENGREKFWAQDANGKSIPIDITNGSKLLINGRDVEQSINNVGALSAALTGLPTVPTETTLSCGLGTGTHGGDFAFSGGCASKVNEKLSINYAASMTMPGQDYAGDFEDTFSARAGFIWKLGKSSKPSLISLRETNELKKAISELRENNNQIISQNENLQLENQSIISQNKTLLARLERLEKVALGKSKSQDLANIKLP